MVAVPEVLDRLTPDITGTTRGILLQPLLGLDQLQEIGGGDQGLAQQWIGTEGDGRHKIVELAGR